MLEKKTKKTKMRRTKWSCHAARMASGKPKWGQKWKEERKIEKEKKE